MNRPPALLKTLHEIFSADSLATGDAQRIVYSYGNSRRQALQDSVVFPTEHAQVEALLPRDDAERERVDACLAEGFALVMSLEDTLSGEHGIGMVKREFMPRAVEASTLDLMRNIKTAFDPDCILNPGMLLP